MNVFEIPTIPSANQRKRFTLDGVTYTLALNFNTVAQVWVMDIYAADGVTPILLGRPLVTGTDLLGQFTYLDIGRDNGMVTATIAVGIAPTETPTFDNLGVDGHLYIATRV